jgi:hypothetical protein
MIVNDVINIAIRTQNSLQIMLEILRYICLHTYVSLAVGERELPYRHKRVMKWERMSAGFLVRRDKLPW